MIIICLSTYNGIQFLQEQLSSLEDQDYNHSDFLLLCRDDGSDDESYEFLRQFTLNSSLQVKLLTDCNNMGVKKSFELLMNTALDMGGEYILFCDQDDIWKKDKIEKTILKMKEMENQYPNLPILVHSDLAVVDEDMNLLNNSFWKYQNIDPQKSSLHNFIVDNNITGCTAMLNSHLARLIQNIPKEAIMHDWWIAMVASTFGQIGYINEPLILYRQHARNDTGAKKYGWRYGYNQFLKKPSLMKYITQAKVFLEQYRSHLTSDHIEILDAISRLDQMNWFEKRKVLIKYKIFKNGFIRNLGLMVFA